MAAESNFVDYVKIYCRSGKLSRVSMKCSEEEAILLREQYDCIGLPYNANKNFAKYWIGIDITRADDELIKRLIKGSLEIVGKKTH